MSHLDGAVGGAVWECHGSSGHTGDRTMHLGSSRDRGCTCVAAGWLRATWGLLSAASLAACGSVRTELCTTIHARVLEELRTSDWTARYVLDPWSCEWRALRLRELAKELRALEARDGSLRPSVEAYRLEVERLAEAYERLAAAYRNSQELPPEEAQRVHSALSRGVLDHAAALNPLRAQVQSACNGF
ncbi:hypothetical protein [Hyalangium gracile]|uniref:hypothetical protein n=1 Tax=Hyalangium gracile TaxID=394092 RepID=UPI001CCC1EB9|nr:hypothetical protein [Hyalangium gracile]